MLDGNAHTQHRPNRDGNGDGDGDGDGDGENDGDGDGDGDGGDGGGDSVIRWQRWAEDGDEGLAEVGIGIRFGWRWWDMW